MKVPFKVKVLLATGLLLLTAGNTLAMHLQIRHGLAPHYHTADGTAIVVTTAQ